MSLETIGSLVALALVDSTSFGTLLVPLLLVLANRRIAWRPMGIYLGTVLLFYFVVGVALVLGLDAILTTVDGLAENRALRWAELGLGIALFALSWRFDGKGKENPKDRRSRLAGVAQQPRAMVALALSATLVEVATMVPYLAAIGLIARDGAPVAVDVVVLFGYCVVMILPALVILALATVLGDRIWPRLERFGGWMDRQTASAMGWIVGIVGFFIAADAASFLFRDDESGDASAGMIRLLVYL